MRVFVTMTMMMIVCMKRTVEYYSCILLLDMMYYLYGKRGQSNSSSFQINTVAA